MRRDKRYLLFILVLITSCFGNKKTLDEDYKIKKIGKPFKIEYFKSKIGEAFMVNETAEFTITEKSEIEIAINEIIVANNPEPWKGAGWNKIVISYSDTILNINTNNKKIGLGASGTFYSLNRNNFITKRLVE